MSDRHDEVTLLMVAAAVIVAGAGIFLVLLAAATVFARRRAERFLAAFAGSARAHIIEQVARMIVGGGLVVYAPRMRIPVVFEVLGWLLIVTSACLLLIPWRWHHRFGGWAIPLVIRHMKLYGLGACALGVLILVAMI